MLEFIDDNFLSQLVTEPTREDNILDLVIASQEHLIKNIIVGEHVSSCNHKVVRAEINTANNIVENKIFLPNFRRGNFERLKRISAFVAASLSLSQWCVVSFQKSTADTAKQLHPKLWEKTQQYQESSLV